MDLRKYLRRQQLKTSLIQERKQSPKSRKHRVLGRINSRNAPRHTVITPTKIREEEKNTKSNKGKATNNIQGNFHHALADFSAETLQARREWHNIFKVMNGITYN